MDLNIGPMPLSAEERQAVSAIIAQYRTTGEVPNVLGKTKVTRKKKRSPLSIIERARTTTPKSKKKIMPVSESGK